MTRTLCFVVLLMLVAASVLASRAGAQVLTTLHNFGDGSVANDGITPDDIIQGSDGNFYGAAVAGGANGGGVLFKMTPSGTVTILTSLPAGFSDDDDDIPVNLTQSTDGNFYGQGEDGGSGAYGAVFKMTPSGTFTILHNFLVGSVPSDGVEPEGALVEGLDGNFYGLTEGGGTAGPGTVYRITPTGTETVLHSFGDGSVVNDGADPEAGALVLGTDGDFYGTTIAGGADNAGTVFKITPSGMETVLYSFSNTGYLSSPYGTMLQACDGNFYGNYTAGIFKITPAGTLTSLYALPGSSSFSSRDYGFLISSLVQGPGGYLYGTTQLGGTNYTGTIFQISTMGVFTTLYSFSALSSGTPGTNTDGANPVAAIALGSDGNLYGTTTGGGTAGDGTVFRFHLPGTPLTVISLSPAATLVGSPTFTLTVTGTNFTANSTVTIEGIPVTVTARTTTQLTVTVPTSAIATTGVKMVTVTDPANGMGCATFDVAPLPLTIVSLDPASVTVGGPAFSMTVTGTNFTGNTTVTVGGTPITVTSQTTTKLTVTVPASAIIASGAKTVVVSDPVHGSASATFTASYPWNVQDVAAVSDGTARLLWDREDGAAGIWALSSNNTQTLAGPTYGPYQGWTAQDITAAGDGTSRILWNRYDGATGVWAMDAHGNQTSVSPTYGPFSGWKAIDLATAPNGTSRLMWRYTNGEAGILTLNATGGEIIVGRNYGPYTGWTATAVGAAGDGTARMLWTRSDGAMGLWSMDSGDLQTTVGPTYGPYSDSHGAWTATDLSTSADGTSCVLWKRSDGAIGVWTFSANNTMTTVGSVYGPYSGFTAAALDAADDKARVLWVRSDRAAGLWSFGTNDLESLIGPVYGPY